MQKFPFCSISKDLPQVTQQLTARERFKRLEDNPNLFQGFEGNNAFQDPEQVHLSSARAPRQASEPSTSRSRPIYERRQFAQETKEALRTAAKPNLSENKFLDHFEEFNRAISHFLQNGKSWPKPQGLVLRLNEIMQIRSHEEWLEWILTVKTNNGQDYNWFHPDWSKGIMREQFAEATEVERTRIRSFSNTFLEFTRCQRHRHKVLLL